MVENYHNRLFKNYSKSHLAHIDSNEQAKMDWFIQYAQANYRGFLEPLDKQKVDLLEIGCSRGYLLSILCSWGFTNLDGIDLSLDDVEHAQQLVPQAHFFCEDAFVYLDRSTKQYDVIIFKAVLEHVAKANTLPFLTKVNQCLKPGGIVIVDVPNMDWLFAQHERYMDFTHEVGFTQESLGQILRNIFSDVELVKGKFIRTSPTLRSRMAMWLRPATIMLLNGIFKIVGEGAGEIWWDCRSLIAVARK